MPSLWSLLEHRAAADPDGLCIVDEHGHELTFATARAGALRMAAGLAARGVGDGTVVSWELPNWLETIQLTLALSRLGAVQNPLVPILRAREVGFICRQARSEFLVVPDSYASFDYVGMANGIAAAHPGLCVLVAPRDLVDGDPDALPPLADDGPLTARWLFYTSGTTADPKGARHTDESVIAATRGFIEALSITDADRVSLILPITHVGGVVHLMASLLTGAPLVSAAAFDPESTVLHLREQGATTLPGGMPFIHAYFAFQDRHPELDPLFPAGRLMAHGGAPKPPSLFYEAKRRLGTAGIVSGYGMTECPMAIWNRPGDADADLATTEGRPVSGVELRCVTADGGVAGAGEEGEVRVRGPQMMLGYVDASLDSGAFDSDGFFRSGDLGIIDGNGRLTITGRLKDIIIRNMENISAQELENLLHTHGAVADVAVIGVPNERTGEIACAVVVPADAANPPSLDELCRHLVDRGLSNRKLPERLELVDALPRNAMQKILKNELRSRFG